MTNPHPKIIQILQPAYFHNGYRHMVGLGDNGEIYDLEPDKSSPFSNRWLWVKREVSFK